MIHVRDWFIKGFIVDTYSSIKGRGIHKGLARVKKALRNDRSLRYCLKLDIRKFYQSIDTDILKKLLERKIKDNRFINLLFEIIDSYDDGVPIGNYTSQYFGNFYLSGLDHYVKEKLHVRYYFRYCDDIVVIGCDKDILWKTYHDINQYVTFWLNLDIKPNYQVFPIESRSIDFLGYRTYHSYSLLRKNTKKNFVRRVMIFNSTASYWGMIIHGNCRNLWKRHTNTNNFKEYKLWQRRNKY